MDKMVEWINKYIVTHPIPKEKAPKGRPRKWKLINKLKLCHGTEAVATERMYLRSLQDVARSIVRVEGVRR